MMMIMMLMFVNQVACHTFVSANIYLWCCTEYRLQNVIL